MVLRISLYQGLYKQSRFGRVFVKKGAREVELI